MMQVLILSISCFIVFLIFHWWETKQNEKVWRKYRNK